ncbi:hypothetical protein FQ775_23195 [Nitratireductor mangrovi]|uniref:Uncharacterized protein n=1 Tax=Nitratireductor mangrovi TaxID=2599600 RepID=A0A5B8L6I6_9HYPH|nr:hypothetical protein [Nitratireductor mangrovi]QDZ03038.1 hypothetical protein FQ775_23195 [Nitratireductor mangrovi]
MLKYVHSFIYAGMSAGYAGTCIGADKLIVSGLLAALYLVLAIEDFRNRRNGGGGHEPPI